MAQLDSKLTEFAGELATAKAALAGVINLPPASAETLESFVQARVGINVRDYGAKGDGVANDTTAFQAALTANPGKQILIPPGTYLVTSPVLGDGTQLVEYAQGASITGGGGVFSVSRVIVTSGRPEFNRTGPTGSYETAGHLWRATNTSNNAGYGFRMNFTQQGTVSTGFSIGHGVICDFSGVGVANGGGQGLASWLVSATSTDQTKKFGVFGQEINVMNRAKDFGYARYRGALQQWTGGIQFVPEANDLVNGGGNICHNVTYGFAVARSGEVKQDGDYCKTYNGVLIEKDAIAPNGRGVLVSGDSTADAAKKPLYAIEVDQRWKFALYTREGVFDSGRAILMGNNQWIAIENAAGATGFKVLGVNTNDDVVIAAAKANGEIRFAGNTGLGPNPSGGASFSVLTDAAATSYVRAETTTGTEGIAILAGASGTLTNVNVRVVPKGSGVPMLAGVRNYADDAAAAAGGVPIDGIYRTGNALKIRIV